MVDTAFMTKQDPIAYRRFAQARKLQAGGHFDRAISAYEEGIKRLAAGPRPLTQATKESLGVALEQLLDLLRWQQQYHRGVRVLVGLGASMPEFARRYELDLASFQISAGEVVAGLARLRKIKQSDPQNIYVMNALGAELISLGQLDEAESVLTSATALTAMPKADSAQAYWLLFDLFCRKADMEKTEAAWLAGCQMDPNLAERRLEVIRALIYWRHFQKARAYIERETNEALRYFYFALCEFNGGSTGTAINAWRLLVERRIPGAEKYPDEYAEACLFVKEPGKAVDILRPLVNAGQVHVWRLVVIGLAYALLVDLPSAKHYLEVGLRLAGTVRPRQARPGTGDQIIHSGPARDLYGQIITATDLRVELDRFFIPLPASQE